MSTPQRRLAQAQDAERMASLVSYGRDRERLLRQAAEWRAQAAELEAGPEPLSDAGRAGAAGDGNTDRSSWLRRCSQALFGPRRGRGG